MEETHRLTGQYENMEANLPDLFNKLRVSELETMSKIAEKKRELIQMLDDAEKITLDDLKRKADILAKNISRNIVAVKEFRKRALEETSAEWKTLETDYNSISSKLMFPEQVRIFSELVPIVAPIYRSSSCGDKLCLTCEHMKETWICSSSVKGNTFRIKQNMNCKTKNVVYLITCSCGLQYVGETKNQLNQRIRRHKENASAIAKHLAKSNHLFEDLIVQGIEHNKKWSKEERKQRENYWMDELLTLSPRGLNERR